MSSFTGETKTASIPTPAPTAQDVDDGALAIADTIPMPRVFNNNTPSVDPAVMDVSAARAKMKARMGKNSRTGGKGSARRKKKAVRKTTGTDEKRLQATLKRLNVNNIPAIEEVNLFKDNGTVIHFASPKVQASIAANTYVVSGQCETKNLQELLPGIINQLGPDNLANLKKIASSYSGDGADDDDDDDDIPDLVENFDDAASK